MIPARTLLIGAAAATGLSTLALRLTRSPPLILMYHGVSCKTERKNILGSIDYKHLPLDAFADHLRVLHRSRRRVISLSELVDGLYGRQDMSNTVVITFDDGYENNYLVAAPALADRGMPATFFLATGFIGADQLVWTDRLEVALDRTSCSVIQLPQSREEMPIGSLAERRRALDRIKRVLKSQGRVRIDDAVERLVFQLGVPNAYPEGDYRFMDWNQARDLVRGGFEVGAHTITHPILSQIPIEEAAFEIIGSRDKIIQETGQCSETFCFPNGKSDDFNSQIIDLCRKSFKAALSTNRGQAAFEDIFELKRLGASGQKVERRGIEWLLLRGPHDAIAESLRARRSMSMGLDWTDQDNVENS